MCNVVDERQNENSMFQFVKVFSRDMANSVLPAVGDMPDKVSVPSKRSNLSLNTSHKRPKSFIKDESFQLEKNFKGKITNKGNFTLLPVITAHKLPPKAYEASTSRPNNETTSKSLIKNEDDQKVDPYRNLTVVTGNVEFVMKIHKSYGSSDLLYEVYGKILRISPGKFPCERVILLRNESGPVLQAVFYEIDVKLQTVSVGVHAQCVGKFKGTSRIHLFKIKVLDTPPNEESLIRLQNLCNFTLNKMKDMFK